MPKSPKDDQYSEEETKRRAEEALRVQTPPVYERKEDAREPKLPRNE
jgi:hypothetical protein